MLLHSFDRFYVMTKFVLPKIEDLKFTTIKCDSSCKYLDTGRGKGNYPSNYIPNLTAYWKKIVPYCCVRLCTTSFLFTCLGFSCT